MKSESSSLSELETSLGVSLVKPNTCWLDGETCPYGHPYGRFNDRPGSYCHTNEGGCSKLRVSTGIQIFTGPIVDKAVDRFEKDTKKEIDENRETLHELLACKANSLVERGSINETEKGILLCASKVLEEQFPQVEVMEIRD